MTRKFYLVTGVAGFKGGVLAKRLLVEGNPWQVKYIQMNTDSVNSANLCKVAY